MLRFRPVLRNVSRGSSKNFSKTSVSAYQKRLITDSTTTPTLVNKPFIDFTVSLAPDNVIFPDAEDISEHRQVVGQVFKLWNAIEVAISVKDIERAESCLMALYQVVDFSKSSSAGTFIDAFNKVFYGKVQNNPDWSLNDIEEYVKNKKADFPELLLDGRSASIFIRAAIDRQENYKKYFQNYKISKKPLIEIFSNVDILGIHNLQKIYRENTVRIEQFPKDVRDLVDFRKFGTIDSNNVSNELGREKADMSIIDDAPETLKKLGLEELKSVDSFGMKVIRHSLHGLGTSVGYEMMRKFLDKFENPEEFIDLKTKSVNFFKIYCNLKSEEEKKEFHELLNDLNEKRQRQLEARSIEGAELSWQHSAETAQKTGGLKVRDSNFNLLLWKWYCDLLPLIKTDVDIAKKYLNIDASTRSMKNAEALKIFSSEEKIRLKIVHEVAPYLILLTPEKITVITILEILRASSTTGIVDGLKSSRAVVSIGRALEYEHKSEKFVNEEDKIFKGISDGERSLRLRKIIQRSKNSVRQTSRENDDIEWTVETVAKLGSIMVSNLIKIAKVSVKAVDPRTNEEVFAEVPAITHGYQYANSLRIGVLKFHKELLHKLGTENLRFSVYPQSLPMLVEPCEWVSWNSGGYQFSRENIIRTKSCPEQIAYIKAADKKGNLDSVYEGVNYLGKTAWTVNEEVLKVLTHFWNSETEFLTIPKVVQEPEIPPAPPRNSDPTVRRDWQRMSRQIANSYANDRSIRCDANYKLEIARAFVGERFYFPHNLDFRGRAYPLAPHFNHLGNDISRGLLIFWEGKKLGIDGLFWLKVHLANLFGHSKLTFDERVKFTDDNIEKIKQSAENPYDRESFWATAEDPWQALATIFEINEALKLEDPSEFISHQPIHQDGTCNGLQHYAALGGDLEGARQVNLDPSDRPQDVYNHVCTITKQLLEKEIVTGSEDDKFLAKSLLPKLSRKIVKQTVMTNVYGVTFIGANAQIKKKLIDYYSFEEVQTYSLFLTHRVFEAIKTLFSRAHQIQDWLGICAQRVSKSVNVQDIPKEAVDEGNLKLHMSSVIWTTPLGLPVVQPYRQATKHQVQTNLQTVYLEDPFEWTQVHSMKQVNGFAPNYVHSLDATHMLLSALEAKKIGIDFASVHDSYWTHAGSVNSLNKLLRESFVKLHTSDLIGQLATELEQRYKNNMLIYKIPVNSMVGKKIKEFKSKYLSENKVRLSLLEQLKLERKRAQLLASNDPKDSEEGQSMETVITILNKDDIEYIYKNGTSKSNSKKDGDIHLNVLVPFKCPPTPERGEFDVRKVLNSKYFFS